MTWWIAAWSPSQLIIRFTLGITFNQKKKTTSAKQRVKIFKLDSAFAPLSLINLFTRGCKGPWKGQCEQGEPVKINIVKKLIYPYVSNMSRNLTTKVNYEFSFDNDSQRPLRVNKKNHQLPKLSEQVDQLSPLNFSHCKRKGSKRIIFYFAIQLVRIFVALVQFT